MKMKLPVLNFLLILILFLLLGWEGQSWLQPKFSSTFKGDAIVPAPRELETSALSRQVYSNAMMADVTRLNIFREQRKKYYRPIPPKPKPKPKRRPLVKVKPAPPIVAVAPPPPSSPHKLTPPPPQLVLTGIMIMANQKVAIFEGTYSEIRGGQLVQNLKPRRRGYKVGDTLGGYRIKTVDKSHATLSAIAGNNLTLTISKTPPTQKIQKAGNDLIQKGKPVAKNIRERSSASRTRKSQPIPIRKKPLSKSSPSVSSPSVATPDGSVPSPDPSKPNRLQRLRQRSMGF